MQLTEDAARRFIEKIEICGPDECWEWLASTNADGYGQLKVNGKVEKAHRLAWEFWRGPIPDGLCVLHHCDNPPCCNPRDLWLGTKADNAHDRDTKGRRVPPAGELNGRAKLTARQVATIYRRFYAGGVTKRALGLEYGVSDTQVRDITNGKSWPHLTDLLEL